MIGLSTFGFSSWAEVNAYVTFVALGMSIMMVVSAITSAPAFITEYYKYATGDPQAKPDNASFWINANTFFNVGTYCSQVLMEPLALTPMMRRLPLRLRLFAGLLIPFLEMLLMVIVPAAKIPTQNGAVAVLMVVAVLGGFSKALCNSCTNALVGPFPTKFMNGFQWGLTVSALFMSIVQIILKVSMDTDFDSVMTQSRIYFGIGIAVQLFTIFEFAIMPRNSFVRTYVADFRVAAAGYGGDAAAEPISGGALDLELAPAAAEIVEEEQLGEPAYDKEKELDSGADEVRAVSGYSGNAAVLRARGDADHMVDVDQTGQLTSSDQMVRASLLPVVKKVWPMLVSCFLIFFMSLLLFPGVFFSIDYVDPWYMTIIVLLFNVGDFAARVALMIPFLRPTPVAVVIGAVARIVVIVPLLVLCQRQIIPGHALPYVLITAVGFTNGYFGAMACIYCPRTPTLDKAGERSLAAILSGVFLMLGLCAGSNFALLINLTL